MFHIFSFLCSPAWSSILRWWTTSISARKSSPPPRLYVYFMGILVLSDACTAAMPRSRAHLTAALKEKRSSVIAISFIAPVRIYLPAFCCLPSSPVLYSPFQKRWWEKRRRMRLMMVLCLRRKGATDPIKMERRLSHNVWGLIAVASKLRTWIREGEEVVLFKAISRNLKVTRKNHIFDWIFNKSRPCTVRTSQWWA